MFTRWFCLAACCALVVQSSGQAAVVNGDFETGTPSGWTTVGSVQTKTSAFGVTPTEGTYQGYLETTGNYTAVASLVASSLGITAPTVMALPVGTPVNGSGMHQTLTVTAGQTLWFDWNFLTDELDEAISYNDFAILTVDDSAVLLASHNSSTFDLSSPPAGFDGQTGWSTSSYTFSAGGTYKVGFAVFNVGDAGHNSVLLLDGIHVLPVPEPASLSLLGMAAAGLVWRPMRRRGRLNLS